MAIKKTDKVENKVEVKATTLENKVEANTKVETRETKSTDFCWAVRDESVKSSYKKRK
jgi:hypothetical protein